jgi:hypothetical protein
VRRGEQHLEEPDEHRDTVEEEEPSEDTGQEPGAQHQPAEGEKSRGRDVAHPRPPTTRLGLS